MLSVNDILQLLVAPLLIYGNIVFLLIILACTILAALPSIIEIKQTDFENAMRILSE